MLAFPSTPQSGGGSPSNLQDSKNQQYTGHQERHATLLWCLTILHLKSVYPTNFTCANTQSDDIYPAFPRAELCCIVEQTATCEPFHHPITIHRATPRLTVSCSSPFRAVPAFPSLCTLSQITQHLTKPPLTKSAHQKPSGPRWHHQPLHVKAQRSKRTTRGDEDRSCGSNKKIKKTGRDARLHTHTFCDAQEQRPGQTGKQHLKRHTRVFLGTRVASSALRDETEKSAGSAKE